MNELSICELILLPHNITTKLTLVTINIEIN